MIHKTEGNKTVYKGIVYLMVLTVASGIGLSASTAEVAKDVMEESGKKMVDGKEHKLVWSDEFAGSELDQEKWRNRLPSGYGYANSLITKDGCYLDGEGHLVLALCALTTAEVEARATTKEEKEALAKLPDNAWVHAVSDIITRRAFLNGYHEIRFKLPLVPGPGLCFWFPGTDDKATEIDVIEQSLYHQGALVDFKASTIHWYPGGYSPENRQCLSYEFIRPRTDKTAAAQPADKLTPGQRAQPYNPEPPRIIDHSTNGLLRKTYAVKDDYFRWDDGQFHTVAVLWTLEKYSFYYDGHKVCTFEAGISRVPEPAILSLRCMDSLEKLGRSKGRNNPRETPARVLVDYYRLYEAVGK